MHHRRKSTDVINNKTGYIPFSFASYRAWFWSLSFCLCSEKRCPSIALNTEVAGMLQRWTQTAVVVGMWKMRRKQFAEHLELCPLLHLCTCWKGCSLAFWLEPIQITVFSSALISCFKLFLWIFPWIIFSIHPIIVLVNKTPSSSWIPAFSCCFGQHLFEIFSVPANIFCRVGCRCNSTS